MSSTRAKHLLLHGLVAVAWLVLFRLLARYAVYLLPDSFANTLSLQAYLAAVAVVATLIGLGIAWVVLPEPRAALGLGRPSARGLALSAGLALPAYVLVSAAAIAIALPTLLDELRRGGRALAQQSTGEFGRALVQSPALLTLLWGAVISPIAEELLFRGALWTWLQRVTARVMASRQPLEPADSTALPAGVITDGWGLRTIKGTAAHLRDGGLATLLVGAVFGYLHMDTPGGLGIVRAVSAFGLGFATGLARHLGGNVWCAVVLHVLFNTASLATARRWVVSEAFPLKYGMPTLLIVAAAVSALATLGLHLATRRRHAN
ncbi:MAG: CPBP family intramembrane glutamic endopeptidase [Polyangiaceae bacterium]